MTHPRPNPLSIILTDFHCYPITNFPSNKQLYIHKMYTTHGRARQPYFGAARMHTCNPLHDKLKHT